jgi:hypothetical protein
MKKALLFYLGAAFVCTFLLFTQAEAITFDLNTQFSGDINLPPGQSPWLTASFENVRYTETGYNAVELKLVANGLTSNNEYVSGWYFNYNKLAGLTFTFENGPIATASTGIFPADGAKGEFSLLFDFPDQGDLFSKGETAVILIEGLGISAESFNLLNDPGNFYSAAEIIRQNGNGIGGAGSAWIAATNQPTKPVPEPATMLLLSAGLIGLGFFGRKRFLK